MASLQKYSGQWSEKTAAHLLRRTTFGIPYETLKQLGKSTVDEVVDTLLKPLEVPPPPINENVNDDPDVQVGQTWVNAPYTQETVGYKRNSLYKWTFGLMMSNPPNVREKMTLFWHNHFVTAQINDPRYVYINIEKLRRNSMGDFRQMTKDMTIDPAMLFYLNGNENSRQAPNENYARELLELFTVGKGELAGPGDYTTFTEDDVKEMARSLTGWQINRLQLENTGVYRPNRHDTGTKQLSPRFGSKVIENGGENEYKQLIDVILESEAVAHHIVSKMYRWFVHHDITPEIEENIIQPLAQLFREIDYQIKPVIEMLLKSEHFYDECVRGVMIKSPIDIILNPLAYFTPVFPQDIAQNINIYRAMYDGLIALENAFFNAPDVAGWQPYYQEPSYDRLWLNATSLPVRKLYSDAICTVGISRAERPNIRNSMTIDLLDTIEKMDMPNDAQHIVDELSLMLFPKSLADNQKDVILNLMNFGQINGWSLVYQAYKSAPDVERNKIAVTNILKATVVYMMRMPEYSLS